MLLAGAAEGPPERKGSHYVVLGDSDWFAGLAKDMDSIRIPLSGPPASMTSLTYGDSLSATGSGTPFGYASPNDGKAYRGNVCLLE